MCQCQTAVDARLIVDAVNAAIAKARGGEMNFSTWCFVKPETLIEVGATSLEREPVGITFDRGNLSLYLTRERAAELVRAITAHLAATEQEPELKT